MPLISVIIPVYNVEKYIRRCIDSVLIQTFHDFELLLVDDGSPDNCPTICDEYAGLDSRIRVIHKKNGGLSSARNAGIEAARGKYLFFLDSDDMIHFECLQVLIKYIDNKDVEIVLSNFERFEGDKPKSYNTQQREKKIICKNNIETLNVFFDDSFSLSCIVSACGKLWKASLFESIRFPEGKLFEDEFTTYKLYFKAKKVVFTNYSFYYYFVNNAGITGTLNLEKRFDEYDAQWERLSFFIDTGLDSLVAKAAIHFLKTAQWDLIDARKNRNPAMDSKKIRLEQQYEEAFEIAKKAGVLKLLRDYDYYILAKPQLTLLWRIRRQLGLHLLGNKDI